MLWYLGPSPLVSPHVQKLVHPFCALRIDGVAATACYLLRQILVVSSIPIMLLRAIVRFVFLIVCWSCKEVKLMKVLYIETACANCATAELSWNFTGPWHLMANATAARHALAVAAAGSVKRMVCMCIDRCARYQARPQANAFKAQMAVDGATYSYAPSPKRPGTPRACFTVEINPLFGQLHCVNFL